MTDDVSEELDELMDDIDAGGSTLSPESETDEGTNKADGGELSKEEIADEFEVLFAKKQGNSVQHLVHAEADDTLCGVGLGTEVKQIETPGPFDPICKRCRSNLLGGSLGSNTNRTYNDLRQWLANEIEGVQEATDDGSSDALRKSEAAAIVSHIQSLKENIE